MATLLVRGTQLESNKTKAPLNRYFLYMLGATFLVAMHFFMPNPGGSGLALSFNPTTWITASFAIAIGCYQLGTNKTLRYSKLTIILFACCCILTFPIFLPSAEWGEAIHRIIGLWAGFSLFVLLQQFRFSNGQKQALLWFILVAVAIEAVFGWVQYLYLQPGNIFGYNTLANRPYGIFQQPNVMASFLATGLVLSGYMLARQPQKYRRDPLLLTFIVLIPIITVPLILVIASRTGWLTAIVGSLLVLPYLWKFSTKRRFAFWVSAILAGLLIGNVGSNLATDTTSDLIQYKADKQGDIRTTFYKQGLDMIIEKPLTGYGYGKFEPAYMLYTARQHQLNTDYPVGTPALDHPHNELMMWGVEGGAVPVIAIIITALFVLYKIYSARNGTRLALLGLLTPLVIHSQLEYPFYHSAIHWITFIVLLFWLDQRTAKYKMWRFSKISKVALRVSSLVLPMVTAFYMISALHTNYVLTQFEKSQPKQPELLDKVTNPVVWKDRFDWDVYSTYLTIGLYTADPKLIQPYIDWSQDIISRKPRPAFYTNLILAHQGMRNESKAKLIRSEAEFLFPNKDFSKVNYQPPSTAVPSSADTVSQAAQ